MKVKISIYGHVYKFLDEKKITKWKSKLFTIVPEIDHLALTTNSDLNQFAYSDENFKSVLPAADVANKKADIFIYLTDRPLECNYYSRVLDKNRIVITYYQAKELLDNARIPLENYLMSSIYSYVLMLMAIQGKELTAQTEIDFMHTTCEDCLFDFCGTKEDMLAGCIAPTICTQSRNLLESHGVPSNVVMTAQKELRRLQREPISALVLFLDKHPFWSGVIFVVSSVAISLLTNMITCLFSH